MRNPSTLEQEQAPASDTRRQAAAVGEDFRQTFVRIQPLDKAKPKATRQADAETESTSIEMQLAATKEALVTAHVSLVQIGLELEGEREARQQAEAKSLADQRASEEAMHLLKLTVQPLRDLKAATAEQAELQAEAYAALQAEREALEARLQATEAALEREAKLAAGIREQVETERRAREDAEAKRQDEKRARENALRALVDFKSAAAEERAEALKQTRAYEDLRRQHESIDARLKETEAALEQAVQFAEQVNGQLETERSAREESEIQVETERHAREATFRALLDLQNEAAEQRAQAEEQARAYADLQAQHEALRANSKNTQPELMRAADVTAQLELEVEEARLARQDAESKAYTARQARDAAVEALHEVRRDLAAQRMQAEQQARAYAALEAKHKNEQAQREQTEAALAQAQDTANRHAERVAQITADFENERLVREHVEKRTQTERRAREEAEHALYQKNEASGFWKKLRHS
jgi:hypothetical protein